MELESWITSIVGKGGPGAAVVVVLYIIYKRGIPLLTSAIEHIKQDRADLRSQLDKCEEAREGTNLKLERAQERYETKLEEAQKRYTDSLERTIEKLTRS